MDQKNIASVEDLHGSFRNLIVWQRAVELCVAIYKLTSVFPPSEQFGLTNQLRRAAVSIASNIAEGYGKSSRGKYLQFLGHARGSNFEVQSQMVIARKLGFGVEADLQHSDDLATEVGKMLVSLMKKLR